ncbi:MAG TPA: galactokinase [Streptosporangiaceae bacterium]|nr:galactokinase [Streptosporangiaceae bacterium]
MTAAMGPAGQAADARGADGPAAGARGAAAGRRSLAQRCARWFRECFGAEPDGVWLAPGRVNLIGEHTDYNEGFVLPFALGQGVAVAASPRPDGVLALRSRQHPAEDTEVPLGGLAPGVAMPGWAAYPAGVAWALREAGYPVRGASIAIDSDLPAGAGLSSSAALECSAALALVALARAGEDGGRGGQQPAGARDVPRQELAAIARRAENDFAGVPCGIMDQSAALLCRAGHALLLDCRSLETSQVPFAPEAAGLRLLVIDTRAQHELSGGEYGSRRAQCEEAARRLGVSSLRAVTDPGELDRLDDPVLRRRARHVVADNQRVHAVAGLLRAGAAGDRSTAARVGALLTQSHCSLRDDFEVSWPEADMAVDAAVAEGALGARMIGGGFGGSVIALVPQPTVEQVTAGIGRVFAGRGWAAPGFLDAVPSDGAGRLR